jgi:hypothetical protein
MTQPKTVERIAYEALFAAAQETAQDRDRLKAENERLRAAIEAVRDIEPAENVSEGDAGYNACLAEVQESLRAALNPGASE